jgi:hypothetical protein
MYTEMALTARRFALTLAVAGIAAMGSVAIAPAASAAQDGPVTIVENDKGNGPDQFLVSDHGKKPVFFCEDEKTKDDKGKDDKGKDDEKVKLTKQHNICIDLTGPVRF